MLVKTNLLLDRLGVGVGSVLIPEENTDDIVGSTTDVESPPSSAVHNSIIDMYI